MSTALQTTEAPKPLTIREKLEGPAFAAAIAQVLPKHLTADRMVRIAILAITRTPKLATCDQASFFNALMTLSQLGLEPDGRRAYLIPFENRKRNVVECQLIVGYQGLSELVMRSGLVSNVHADVVCENDVFEFDRGQLTKHLIDFRKPRGEAFAVYALARMRDGGEKCEVMGKDEVERIKERSQGFKASVKYDKDHPWKTDWSEMAKKTAFRRLSKWLPLSPEIRDAIAAEDVTPEPEPPALTFAKPFELPAETIDAAPVADVDGGAS